MPASGDPCFDACQLLRNPWPVSARQNGRRLDTLWDALDLDRERAKAWCLVHAVLNACWEVEDGVDWQASIAYAEPTLLF
jgi:streptomycin 6-kinase